MPNPVSEAAMSDLISADPLMKNKKNLKIQKNQINNNNNNMQHYLLYLGDKITTANNRNRSILEEFTVYVLIK